jgi:hypothetical protein
MSLAELVAAQSTLEANSIIIDECRRILASAAEGDVGPSTDEIRRTVRRVQGALRQLVSVIHSLEAPDPMDELHEAMKEKDHRVSLPERIALTSTVPESCVTLLAYARGPAALEQVSEILGSCSRRQHRIWTLPEGSNIEAALLHYRTLIDQNSGVDLCSRLIVRISEMRMAIAYDADKQRQRQIRASTEQVDDVISSTGMSRSQWQYRYYMGSIVSSLVKGHEGLCALLPLRAVKGWDMQPRAMIKSIKGEQALWFGEIMADRWAPAMCALGKLVVQTVLEGGTLSNRMMASVEEAEYTADWTVERFQSWIDRWMGADCGCWAQ